MATLNINPCNSAGLQAALKKVGDGKDYDTLFLIAGTYDIDDSVKGNPYSVIGINNGSKVLGETDASGNLLVKLKLMKDAPLIPFGCGIPILGPLSKKGTKIEIGFLELDGNNPPGDGSLQRPSTAATCSGGNGKKGDNYGKGFHNWIGAYTGAFQEIYVHDIYLHDSAGDGFRTNRFTPSSDIRLENWKIENCGHCGLMLENTKIIRIKNIEVLTRSNGAVRIQRGCSDIIIDGLEAIGTDKNWGPGSQISGSHILIENSSFENMIGPGLEVAGNDDDDVKIIGCKFKGNGYFPKKPNIYGMGGLVICGCNALIVDCDFEENYGNSIGCAPYTPDGSRPFTKSGFVITVKNCKIRKTKPAYCSTTGNGKHIANLFQVTHKLVSQDNYFYPESTGCLNVVFENSPDPLDEIIQVLKQKPCIILPCEDKDVRERLMETLEKSEIIEEDEMLLN